MFRQIPTYLLSWFNLLLPTDRYGSVKRSSEVQWRRPSGLYADALVGNCLSGLKEFTNPTVLTGLWKRFVTTSLQSTLFETLLVDFASLLVTLLWLPPAGRLRPTSIHSLPKVPSRSPSLQLELKRPGGQLGVFSKLNIRVYTYSSWPRPKLVVPRFNFYWYLGYWSRSKQFCHFFQLLY